MPSTKAADRSPSNTVWLGENLAVLAGLPDASVDLVYVDPPFNTRRTRRRQTLKTERVEHPEDADRIGFGGRAYRTTPGAVKAYADAVDDYLAFLEARLVELKRLLKPQGSLYLHLDWREVHYAKVLMDGIFGRDNFQNEIIWAYDFGGRTKKKWPAKHDTILLYAKDQKRCFFSTEEIDRIPYMAPGLVGPEKAARGKLPTDVWWHTIVPTNGREKTGYPTQKPLGVLSRIVRASCPKGGLVLDAFAGSGTTGEAAWQAGRLFWLIDENPEAIAVMRKRLGALPEVRFLDAAGAPLDDDTR